MIRHLVDSFLLMFELLYKRLYILTLIIITPICILIIRSVYTSLFCSLRHWPLREENRSKGSWKAGRGACFLSKLGSVALSPKNRRSLTWCILVHSGLAERRFQFLYIIIRTVEVLEAKWKLSPSRPDIAHSWRGFATGSGVVKV